MLTGRRGRNRDGFFLRAALARQGISQRQAAHKARMAVEQFNRLCRSTANPTWRVVLRLARALGVCPGDFLRKEGNNAP